MNFTENELEILRTYAIVSHQEDKYVWLREDEKGTYIEYAFKEGAPHDNRCLSWYNSYQPNAIRRNTKASGDTDADMEEVIRIRMERIHNDRVGRLFRLQAMSCGWEEDPVGAMERAEESWNECYEGSPFVGEEHVCRVGCPAKRCVMNGMCRHWTYEEPVKCACWDLSEVKELPKYVYITVEDMMRLRDGLIDGSWD